VFHPIDERLSFLKSSSDLDMLDPIVVREFSNNEGRYRFVIEYIAAWTEITLRRYATAGSSVAGVEHAVFGGDP
jgi:hypothetical protein